MRWCEDTGQVERMPAWEGLYLAATGMDVGCLISTLLEVGKVSCTPANWEQASQQPLTMVDCWLLMGDGVMTREAQVCGHACVCCPC